MDFRAPVCPGFVVRDPRRCGAATDRRAAGQSDSSASGRTNAVPPSQGGPRTRGSGSPFCFRFGCVAAEKYYARAEGVSIAVECRIGSCAEARKIKSNRPIPPIFMCDSDPDFMRAWEHATDRSERRDISQMSDAAEPSPGRHHRLEYARHDPRGGGCKIFYRIQIHVFWRAYRESCRCARALRCHPNALSVDQMPLEDFYTEACASIFPIRNRRATSPWMISRERKWPLV